MSDESTSYVESLVLTQEIPQHVAHVTVKVGNITVNGLKIWRAKNGRIYVHWPSFKQGFSWEDVVKLDPDLRSDIEADVISAYKDERKRAAKEAKEKE